MNFYWLIPFFAAGLLFTLNGAILASAKNDAKKKRLLLLNIALLIWSSLDLVLWVVKFDVGTGSIIHKAVAVCWVPAGFLFLNFIYSLLNKKRDTAYYISLFTVVVTLAISLFTNMVVKSVGFAYWGMYPEFGKLMIPAALNVVIPILYSIFILIKYYRYERNEALRNIYKSLIIGISLTIAITLSVDVILPIVFQIRFISMAPVGNAMLSLFLLNSIRKYHLLELSIEDISREIFDNVTEGVILASKDGRVLIKNSRANELLLNAQTDGLGMPVLPADSKDSNVIKIKVEDPIAGNNSYLNISRSQIISRQGQVLNLYLLNDVTELVKYRNSLIDKNQELNMTLYRIGHDIKGPAAAIQQLAIMSKEDPDNASLYLNKIEISVKQLITFIKEAETLVRIKDVTASPENINLNELIERCWNELEYYRQGEEHQLITQLNCTGFVTKANLMYAIILNIFSNALKYHDTKNKLINKVSVRSNFDGKQLDLEISDNGKGMSEKVVKNLYNLFYRGDTEVQGTGLGMYIVKNAAEKLGAHIDVKSREGEGTTFNIIIPISKQVL